MKKTKLFEDFPAAGWVVLGLAAAAGILMLILKGC